MSDIDHLIDPEVVQSQISSPERREHVRHRVNYYLCAVEQTSDLVLGQVVDISLGGIMLSCLSAIKPYSVVHCLLDAVLPNHTAVSIPAECLAVWCRPEEFGGGFTAGFKFVAVDKGKIQALIDTLA